MIGSSPHLRHHNRASCLTLPPEYQPLLSPYAIPMVVLTPGPLPLWIYRASSRYEDTDGVCSALALYPLMSLILIASAGRRRNSRPLPNPPTTYTCRSGARPRSGGESTTGTGTCGAGSEMARRQIWLLSRRRVAPSPYSSTCPAGVCQRTEGATR
jgi:hypothetical protein